MRNRCGLFLEEMVSKGGLNNIKVAADDKSSAATWSEWRDLNPRPLGPERRASDNFR